MANIVMDEISVDVLEDGLIEDDELTMSEDVGKELEEGESTTTEGDDVTVDTLEEEAVEYTWTDERK
jgi:hypothetical protein